MSNFFQILTITSNIWYICVCEMFWSTICTIIVDGVSLHIITHHVAGENGIKCVFRHALQQTMMNIDIVVKHPSTNVSKILHFFLKYHFNKKKSINCLKERRRKTKYITRRRMRTPKFSVLYNELFRLYDIFYMYMYVIYAFCIYRLLS